MTVFLIAAITTDGYIAEQVGQSSMSWTSREDKKWFSERTKQAGVVVFGSKTYDTIGRSLPGRLAVVMTRQPERYVSDDPNLIFTADTPENVLKMIEAKGYTELAICGGSAIYTAFMKAGLISKLYLTLEPRVFGQGVGLFNESFRQQLRLVAQTSLSDQTLLLEYNVV